MTPELFSLHGKTALITGGGSGIGLAVARSLAGAGARVVLTGRNEAQLAAAAESIGASASWRRLDVTDTAGTPAAVETLQAETGGIDLLINNAGIHLKKPFVETSEVELLAVFQTHVAGALALTRAVVPAMRAAGGGSVVFISSMAALFGIPKVLAYSVAKSALTGAVRALTVELGEDNIRVNAVAPGWIETEMSRRALDGDPARKERILTRTPLRRLGTPAEIGGAVAFLCSPAGSFITGTVIPVDGGVSIGF
jgi:NAD(P)-dependent dehydrogenase (short-subunit alcohol dehydrogenase family)